MEITEFEEQKEKIEEEGTEPQGVLQSEMKGH